MKKYLALLLAGVMMLSLVACGEKQTTDDEQTGNEAGNCISQICRFDWRYF